jgi:hypothetical protein
MTGARALAVRATGALALSFAVLAIGPAASALAAESEEGGATWRLEQPAPPPPEAGVTPAPGPIGLGHIGDIEFIAPNRGLLITSGSGSTIPAGIWAYDGAGWKEIANVCGATDGRIAWVGEDEFWTVSDGRAGQALEQESHERAPLEDDTLCHFADGKVVGSYASLAFRASSYQAMHAAGCLSPADCWFAGGPLPEGSPVTGSFHLHWNGSSLVEEPFEGEAQTVEDMTRYAGQLYEGVRIKALYRTEAFPPVLHTINPAGISPTFEGVAGARNEVESSEVPLYTTGEFTEALGPLRLSAGEGELWAATGPVPENELPSESKPGEVTIDRYPTPTGKWEQLVGASTKKEFEGEAVSSIAAEPGGAGAWVALASPQEAAGKAANPEALATVVHISSEGAISEPQTLPTKEERERQVPAKGGASRIVCPAAHDCWLATTQGWLFHLTTGEESLSVNDKDFTSLISERPKDQGLPQVPPDAPPEESSGPAELPSTASFTENTAPLTESRVTLPLLSKLHARLVHGTTLELRFHLAVRARVRLIAKRHSAVVARTRSQTLAAGSRKLLLALNPHRWPTKLDLQTHALAALPTIPARSPTVDTVSTSLVFPNHLGSSIAGPVF